MPDLGGRPTDYDDSYVHMAYVACVEGGFTDLKLGKLFKVTKQTIYNWQRAHPEFKAAIIEGKDEFDVMHAEQSLLKNGEPDEL